MRRFAAFLLTLAVAAASVAVYAAVRDADPSIAGSSGGAQAAAPGEEVISLIRGESELADSPLASDAASRIEHLFSDAGRAIPTLFTVPMDDGGRCIVTSELVVGSCLSAKSNGNYPATVALGDESTGDAQPPYLYGLVDTAVRAVSVDVDGRTYEATLGNGFYVFKLPRSAQTVESVRSVKFELLGDQVVTRRVTE